MLRFRACGWAAHILRCFSKASSRVGSIVGGSYNTPQKLHTERRSFGGGDVVVLTELDVALLGSEILRRSMEFWLPTAEVWLSMSVSP
jgi:hypothetical protein